MEAERRREEQALAEAEKRRREREYQENLDAWQAEREAYIQQKQREQARRLFGGANKSAWELGREFDGQNSRPVLPVK